MTDFNLVAKQALEYIETNLRATLSVKEISRELNLDPGDVVRAFRRARGITIKRYVDGRLMEKLEYWLANSERSGYEIGVELGFTSDLAFYRWVKRVSGLSLRGVKARAQERGPTQR
jgi:AraC-like DNA-binding protein